MVKDMVKITINSFFALYYCVLFIFYFIDKLPGDYILIIKCNSAIMILLIIKFFLFNKFNIHGGFILLNFIIMLSWIYLVFSPGAFGNAIANMFDIGFDEICSEFSFIITVLALLYVEIYLRYNSNCIGNLRLYKFNIPLLIVKVCFVIFSLIMLINIYFYYLNFSNNMITFMSLTCITCSLLYIIMSLPIKILIKKVNYIGRRYILVINTFYLLCSILYGYYFYINLKMGTETYGKCLAYGLIGEMILCISICNYIYCMRCKLKQKQLE